MTAAQLLARLRAYPLATALFALVIVLAVFWYIRGGPAAEVQSEHQRLQLEWDRITANLNRAEGLGADLEALRAAVEEIGEHLIDPDEKAINYQYFYGLEQATGVRILLLEQSDQLPAVPGDARYQPVEFRLSATGDFRSLADFIYRIERGAQFARLDSFRLLTPNELDLTTLNFEANIAMLAARPNP